MASPFPGFENPTANYYRLPNTWFATMRQLRVATDDRIAAPLKLLEYVLKHTWGYQRFDGHVRLSADELRAGRRFRGQRLDRGTGLSENSVRRATDNLVHFGALEVAQSTDAARRVRTFRPRLRAAEAVEPELRLADFAGFDPPEANYFKVPNVWTDIARPVQSAATLLVVEYFFRHAWGYHNDGGVWLDAEQIAHGRRRANGQRYDEGVGYDVATVYRALPEAVELKLLTWMVRDEADGARRVYNLRWRGQGVDEVTGEYRQPPSGATVPPSRNLEEVSGNVEDGSLNMEEGSRNSEAISLNVEDMGRNLEEVTGNVEAVSRNCEARTASPHTLTDTLTTHDSPTATPDTAPLATQSLTVAVAVDGKFWQALNIENPARTRIAQTALPAEVVVAWALYTWAQPALNRNKAGFLVKRLLDSVEAWRPPERFLVFAQLTCEAWRALFRLIEPYSITDVEDLPEPLQGIAPLWLRAYRAQGWEALPEPVRSVLEAV